MAKVPGSLWIESYYLHFVAADGSEWRYIGNAVQVSSPAVPGSLWVEGDYLHYVDGAGTEFRIDNTFIKTTTGIEGSVWVDNQKRISYLASDRGLRQGHVDVLMWTILMLPQ
jgi:hypothetical protein